jgi:hypothetical protein
MELLLKRNEKPGAMGTRYDLFAKLEAKSEEIARIRKAKPDKTIIVEDELGTRKLYFGEVPSELTSRHDRLLLGE